MVNDTSQRVLQRGLGVIGQLANTLLQIYRWVCFEIILKIAQHLAKLWGKVDSLKRPVRRGTVLLKDEELAGRQELL